jgi:hypothetical protein
MSPNAGFDAGIRMKSAHKRLGWALKGAPLRKKDLRLSALAGIAEGRKLRDKVSGLMRDAGANPADAMVLCVFAQQDLSALVSEVLVLPVSDNGTDVKAALEHADKLPIGFAIFVLDRADNEQPIISHARPLVVEDPRGPLLCEMARQAYERKIKGKLILAGAIPDDSN